MATSVLFLFMAPFEMSAAVTVTVDGRMEGKEERKKEI